MLPHFVLKWINDGSRGINDPLAEVKADGTYATLNIGKTMTIDRDTVTVDKVYVTEKRIMVTYTYRNHHGRRAWSFPGMSLKLETQDGQQLQSHDAGSSGKSWGERGYVSYDLPKQPADTATLVYDMYDRYAKLDIPLTATKGESKA